VLDRHRLTFYFAIFLLMMFSSLMLVPCNAKAQTHLGMNSSQLPPEAKADFYFSQGKFKESLEIYKSILKDKDDASYVFRNMVKAWNAIKALDEGEKFLMEYRRSHGSSSAVWYALGFLHYLKDDNQKAEELLTRATELDAENSLAWNNWAAALSNEKRFQEAVEKVQIAIRANPKELMFFINLKKIYLEMGESSRFEDEFEQAMLNTENPLAWGYGKVIARSLRQKSFQEYAKGNIAGAIVGFKKIVKIYQKLRDVAGQVPALFSLGLLHEESGDAQKGEEFYRQVLAINPGHIQAREKIKPLN
jgi:tetratricopeptide (TPR) repeat protein